MEVSLSGTFDVQRRWEEAFRIRLGERRVSASGKEMPAALDGQIRVTSRSRVTIDAIAGRYGGVTSEWRDGQCQAYLGSSELPVVVLPGEVCVAWWEQWRRKDGGMSVCTHRCDGRHNHQTDTACTCPPVEQRLANRGRWCQPTTRLWIMLPEVEGVGAGRLETHGIIAAETLPQSVAAIQRTQQDGKLVRAVLRIVRVESSGKSFVVPQVAVVDRSSDSLLSGDKLPELQPAGGEDVPAMARDTSEPHESLANREEETCGTVSS